MVRGMITASLDVEIEMEIARSPEEIWAFVSDAERLPEWLDEFRAVVKESDGPVGKGSVFRYTLDGDRSGTLELVDWVPGRRMAWDGPPLRWRGGGARPRGSHEVSAAGDGRGRLVSRYQPELTGTMVFLRPYLKRWLRQQRLADTQRLKQLLETTREAPWQD
jgi:uncharacterized protein YndB with AHSA1/START domain